jgi:hypothetical protein
MYCDHIHFFIKTNPIKMSAKFAMAKQKMTIETFIV